MSGDERRDDREWGERLAGLPRTLPPRADPWPRIAARIAGTGKPAARSAARWRPLAAAAVLVAALGVLLLPYAGRERAPTGTTGSPVTPHGASAVEHFPGWAAALQGTEREYRAALEEFRQLERADAPPGLPLEAYADLGRAVMGEIEKELMAALRRDPDDPYINERLVRLRARQVDLLRQIAAADLAARRQMT